MFRASRVLHQEAHLYIQVLWYVFEYFWYVPHPSICYTTNSYTEFTVAERVDQLHNDKAPANSTANVQALSGKASHHPGLSAPLQPRFGFLGLPTFPKAKIAVEIEEICECGGHTVHKLSQRGLTADWLALRESDCLRMNSKVSSDWLLSYIKTTQPFLEIFKMEWYFADSPLIWSIVSILVSFHTRKNMPTTRILLL
jgi:hypothetical protein